MTNTDIPRGVGRPLPQPSHIVVASGRKEDGGMSIDRSGCTAKYHGNMTAYTRYKCRCTDAREDKRIYVKLGEAGLREPRLIDGCGTQRRLQALAAIGWSSAEIGVRLGRGPDAVQRITRRRAPRVRVVTAEAVKRVYAELSMTPGVSVQARSYAARCGWPPPLAWDDDIIDDPAAEPDLGDKRARTTTDLAEEVRFLRGFGMTNPVIAKRLGVSESWIRQLLGGGKRAAA